MPEFDFPNSPLIGDIYPSTGDKQWIWNGSQWASYSNSQFVNKTYVDNADNLKAPIASPTFTGTVTLPGNPISNLQAATKQYVDSVGIKAFAYVGGGNPASFGTNKGFASVTRIGNGHYTLTLSQAPTSSPVIVATAAYANYNVSAAVYNISGSTFNIRTGFEDGEATTIDSDFNVMVIY